MGGALDFSLTSKGLTLSGFTSSPEELAAFIARLRELMPFLEESTQSIQEGNE
jgi:Tfp pilus assembly protein PilN